MIRRQFAALDEALAPVPHRIAFAVKANSNLAVLRVLRDLGAGADIVSGGELARALAAGFAAGPHRIQRGREDGRGAYGRGRRRASATCTWSPPPSWTSLARIVDAAQPPGARSASG